MTNIAQSGWQEATISDGDTSVDIDLGALFTRIVVLVPSLTGAYVTVSVSRDNSTFFTLEQVSNGDELDSVVNDSRAQIVDIGGMQYIRLTANAAQSGSDANCLVKGVR
ncbi:hypothetical protein LCGC14_2183010 [marine sediment metagenome]|uniref:F5/8 type C domain-containing protein n=1 Tax=marine sediment metagenome TaxID=412755 RepID=A0A0F9FZ60_9ZZZZ